MSAKSSLLGIMTIAAAIAAGVSAHDGPSKTLRQRQPNKLDIVRRASRVKRQGPSAIPQPPELSMCGDTEIGTLFYLTIPDPVFPDRSLYAAIGESDFSASGSSYYRFVEEPEDALTYYFDEACELKRAVGGLEGSAWISPNFEVSPLYIGTASYIDEMGGLTMRCRNEEGTLQCGDNRPVRKRLVANRDFCTEMSGGALILSMKDAEREESYCTPVNVNIVTTLSVQPARRCGDTEVGQPWYLTATPVNNPASLLYASVDAATVIQSSTAQVRLHMDYNMAVQYQFNKQCQLNQVNGPAGELQAWVYDKSVQPIVRFGTKAYVDNMVATLGARMNCRTDDGILSCGANEPYLPLVGTHFCSYANVLSISSNAPGVGTCSPVTLRTLQYLILPSRRA